MTLSINTNFIDKAIGYVAPGIAAKRMQARAGMAIMSRATSGYNQPGSSKRFLSGIDVSSNSPDADTLDKKDGSVALSREMYMTNTLAVAMLKRIKTNTVGTGLRAQSQIDHEFIGISKEAAKKWQRNVEREFRYWAQSKDCDMTRQQNFYELQDLAYFSTLLSGDVCAMFPHKPVKTLNSPVRVRLVESDLLSNPDWSDPLTSTDIAGGIKLDASGAPSTYYFANQYPGENLGTLNPTKWTPIKAFDASGKRQVHHLYIKERPGQRRGMPLLAPVVNDLVKVTKLKDAELTAHVVSSFFTVFVKDNSGFAAPMHEGFVPELPPTKSDADAGINPPSTAKQGLGGGNIIYLDDDKEVQIADARKISDEFSEFYTSFVKELAAAVELPHEQLLLHFTASYSASRGALLEGWKAVRTRRQWLSVNFCQPAYQAWLDEKIASGKIKAPGYFENPDLRSAWSKASWTGMGNGQLDPLKESKAAVVRMNNNLSTHEREYNAIHDDGDWESSVYIAADERDLIVENGLQPAASSEKLGLIIEEKTMDNADDNAEDFVDQNTDDEAAGKNVTPGKSKPNNEDQ